MKNLQEEIQRSKKLMGLTEGLNLPKKKNNFQTQEPKTVLDFLRQLSKNDEALETLVDEMLSSENVDERMDYADEILTFVQLNFDTETYDKWEDEIRDLALAY